MSKRKPDSISIEKSKLLIVEGNDEVQVFGALLKSLGRTDVQVLGIGGKTKIRANLEALIRAARFRSVDTLVIVRDADYSEASAGPESSAAQSAWTSVCDALRNVQIPVPTEHGVLSPGHPRTAIFLCPDGVSEGMLEDVCLKAVAADRASACVAQYFQCLAGVGMVPAQNDRAKAWMHAFLASRPAPDVRLGEAAAKGYLPFGDAAFAPIVALPQAM